MATIKAIEGRSIHQIQSGQVIVDLNSVVKELVENSLDAGATSIDIRFKNQGLDAIEVQDNGKGIAPDDYETVALKHYTSKLSDYDDLSTLVTFGFRGEALSSLCALSKFSILTARAEDGAVGRKLEFEVSGKLKANSVAAAQKGTTVIVEELFYNLPVRRKELEKNIKREYGKVLNLLYQYACISTDVRISASNQMPKGKKVALFSTKGNTTTKENITNIFGAKTLLALCGLDLELNMTPSLGPSTQGARNWSTQATNRSLEVRVQGHISKPVFGEGRQAPDRQMFFVNSRPCQLPQVSKAINEVYKSFNVSQSPFVFANLIMDTSAYDVNVSPDKRTIMLHDQTALLESMKTALTELFERTDHTVPQSTLPSRKLPAYQRPSISRAEPAQGTSEGADNSMSEDEAPTPQNPSKLIHDWIGRDAVTRQASRSLAVKPPPKQDVSNVQSNEVCEEDDPPDAAETSTRVETPNGHVIGPKEDAVVAADPLGSPYDDLFSQRPVWQPLTNGVHDKQETGSANTNSPASSPEPAIPAIAPASQKSTPGPVQNAFDRMRPKRAPSQIAEITVGDTTTTTVIGSDNPYKKRRIHQPANSQAVAKFGASPRLAQGLRRNFAAPGSQLHLDSNALAEDESSESADESGEDTEEAQVEHPPPTAVPAAKPAAHSHAVSPRGPDSKPLASARHLSVDDARDAPSSDSLDDLVPAVANDDEWDEEYVDDNEKKMQEEARVAKLIQEAEEAAARPSEENAKRAQQVLRNGGNRKNSTLQLARFLKTSTEEIRTLINHANVRTSLQAGGRESQQAGAVVKDEIDDVEAENRLSLTVSKSDFVGMKIVGQFNLGFVLALRKAKSGEDEDDLFIIDQHAADEKYNYERLGRTVTLQSQRLVRPKDLELTATQEETIMTHGHILRANGFEIETDTSFTSLASDDEEETPHRKLRLLTLPMSKEKTFDLSDLEELLHLISEQPSGSTNIPRPIKVQKLLAMRACRSSIMVGKTLTHKQMQKVVQHMGEMEKPWNCPHGRPTMRHIAGLREWKGWREGDLVDEDERNAGNAQKGKTDWAAWLAKCSKPPFAP